MRALKYRVEVVTSGLEWAHGFRQPITEFYVPVMGIYFNFEGILNVIKGHGDRFEHRMGKEFEEVELDVGIVGALMNYIESRDKILEYRKALLG